MYTLHLTYTSPDNHVHTRTVQFDTLSHVLMYTERYTETLRLQGLGGRVYIDVDAPSPWEPSQQDHECLTVEACPA